MTERYDLIVNGAGPAGAACALAAARKGLRTALVEREVFPRHKVCGDCLNPSLWPVLEALGVAEAARALPGVALERVRFAKAEGRAAVEIPLPPGAEIAVKRELFDALLLEAAERAGVAVFTGDPVRCVRRDGNVWEVRTAGAAWRAPALVAADGRNSTTCRLLNLSPPARSARVAVQTHAPLDDRHRATVSLEFLPRGYRGIAPVNATEMNLCLVSAPARLSEAKERARRDFHLPPEQLWHAIAPLDRADLPPAPLPGLFLAGDAARVVEPFTGEGIYYALRSGALAAEAAAELAETGDFTRAARFYREGHAAVYRHRHWVNRLARLAVTNRLAGNLIFAVAGLHPGPLRALTRKVVRA